MDSSAKKTDEIMKKAAPVMITMYGICCLLWLIMTFTMVNRQVSSQVGMTDALVFSEDWECDGRFYSMEHISEAPRDPEGRIVATKKLPEDLTNNDLLNFNGKNIHFNVYIEEKLIYSFLDAAQLGQKGQESLFHHIYLGAENAGKTITIVVYPAYDDNSCLLDYMRICSHAVYIEDYFSNFGLGFFISILIVILGFLMVLEYFVHIRSSKRYNFLALGMFTSLVGIWSAIETQIPVLLMGSYSAIILMFDYAVLFLSWYPLTRFITSMFTFTNRVAEIIVCLCQTLFAGVIIYSVYIRHSVDFHDVLKYMYIDAVVFFLCVAGSALKNLIDSKKNKTHLKMGKLPVIAGSILTVSILADLIIFMAANRSGVDAAQYSRMGVAVFMIMIYIGSLIRNVDNEKLADETVSARRLAYVDPLTHLGNRTAFECECEQLEKKMAAGNYDFIIVSMDLNNLKQVNDNGGHDEGDRFLQRAARMIWDSFGHVGECFRVGGDEFVVVIRPDSMEKSGAGHEGIFSRKKNAAVESAVLSIDSAELEKRYRRSLNRLETAENNYNANNPRYPLQIACGFARLKNTDSQTIEEMIKVSDALMYADKRKKKSEA